MAGKTNLAPKLLGLLVALALAVGLAACGSSDSTTTPSTTTGTTTSQETGTTSTGQGGSQSKGGQAKKTSDTGSKSGKSGGKKANVDTPLKVSGGGSKQFIVKGGDNSVQEYGEEKGETELREAAEATHNFFVARAEGRWADACSYLSKTEIEQLEKLATKAGKKGCAPFLSGFTSSLPASVWRQVTTVDAGSLRQEGEQAFLIYYGAPEKTVYVMPMKFEGGEWKVSGLSGSALPGAS